MHVMDSSETGGAGDCVLCEYGKYALYGFLLGGALALAYMAADLILDGALTRMWSRPLAPVTLLGRSDESA